MSFNAATHRQDACATAEKFAAARQFPPSVFYGSGVIEDGCKSVLGQRLKASGLFWTGTGAANLLNLRLALKRNRWDEGWNRRNNSHSLEIHLPA